MWIPVSHLKDKQFQELKIRNRKGVDIEDYNFFYNEHVIWGMTGRILNQFLEETGHLFDE